MGLETIALAATIGSTVISGIGAIQQGNAASAAAGYNAKIAAQNAQIAQQNARYTAAEGEQNVAAAGAETRAKVAAITANQGASGVDINSDSSVGVRESEAKLGMLKSLNLRSQAVRQAYGYETQSANDLAQAKLDKMQGKSAKTAGYLDAGASILGGVGKTADYLKQGDPVGLTGNSSSGDDWYWD